MLLSFSLFQGVCLTSPSAVAPSEPGRLSCWRLRGRPAAEHLEAKARPRQVERAPKTTDNWSETHLSCCRAVPVLQIWCRSKSPHPLYRRLQEEGQTRTVTMASPGRGRMRLTRRRLRVSNTDRLSPGLNVSDSWKRIFPGTSMSKRWIWEKEGVSSIQFKQEFLQRSMPMCGYLPVLKNHLSVRPKHCAGVVQPPVLLFRDRSWITRWHVVLRLLCIISCVLDPSLLARVRDSAL